MLQNEPCEDQDAACGGNVPTISTALELIEVLGGDIGDIMRQLAAARVAPPG